MPSKPSVISLYTGAGGLDYGFEAAGFDTVAAVELDHDCCLTLRHNRKWPVIERSIHEVPTAELLSTAGATQGEVDLLIGGPPCQPFSKSGYWSSGDTRRLDDPRADTLGAYIRVLEQALPRAFLLENVEGLAYSNKSEGLHLLLKAISQINKRTGARYCPTYQVVSAASFGVPQLRERFIMIATREGTPFQFPTPTHADPAKLEGRLGLGDLEPYRTAWDALGDLALDPHEDVAAKGKWADLLPSIPEGQNYLFHTDRGSGLPLFGWRRRFWNFLLKVSKSQPSWTIQAQPGPATGPFHWESRRFSARELCRLQTFPDSVDIQGGRTAIQRQVGNAVPSLLAEVLGRAIRTQLLGRRAAKGPLKLLPADRSPAPPPEPVAPVPHKYHYLSGSHSPHPGTGKGHRALGWSVADASSDA